MRAVVRILAWTYLAGRFQVVGLEGVPRTGALLICANHASTIDPPLIPAFLPRSDTWSLAKSEYFAASAGWRWLMRSYHAFPIVRHSADRGALGLAQRLLARGEALVVYPEGTRVESGGLMRAEPGAGFLARRSGALILPVALLGTRESMPKGARLPRRRRVEIRFGTAFKIAPQRPDGRRVGNQEAADAIMVQVARLLPPEMRGAYAEAQVWAARLEGITEAAR